MPILDRNLLNPEVQNYIVSQTGRDTGKLALSKNPFPEIEWAKILNQIAARTKAVGKLPTWIGAENIIWPSKVSVEQTSSETTAHYKSNLVSGNRLMDLTGGFGVDDYFFSRTVGEVIHCEIDRELSEIARHNFEILGADNIATEVGDGTALLQNNDKPLDWIYIDPSRRNEAKGKVFMLKDCSPDVPGNLDLYFSKSNHILLKVSPLLDIAAGLSELRNVKEIQIVSVKSEVKELLWILENRYNGPVKIIAVDIPNLDAKFEFELGQTADVEYSLPGNYLYEPNAAVMKSGGFDQVSAVFRVGKLHKHSHLYTSENLVDAFPGRSFRITDVLQYNKTEMKKLSGIKANVTTRNFPETVEELRKKWKISDGGDRYYFFTTNLNNEKIILLCAKI